MLGIRRLVWLFLVPTDRFKRAVAVLACRKCNRSAMGVENAAPDHVHASLRREILQGVPLRYRLVGLTGRTPEAAQAH